MGEPEAAPEQIRLKCIRKEGFFTVPPEHRVRCVEALWGARNAPGPRRRGPAAREERAPCCTAGVSRRRARDALQADPGARARRRVPAGRLGGGVSPWALNGSGRAPPVTRQLPFAPCSVRASTCATVLRPLSNCGRYRLQRRKWSLGASSGFTKADSWYGDRFAAWRT